MEFYITKSNRFFVFFWSTYDDARHFRRMAAAGVFDSVKPDSAVPQWITDYEKEVDAAIATLNKSKK